MLSSWVHFEENEKLKLHKSTLPISIQRIIEWTAKIYGDNFVDDIDFNEIEKDLKYQHDKYKDDKKTLKQLYFDYAEDPYDYGYDFRPKQDDNYKMNQMYFDRRTMIHYLVSSPDYINFKW